MYHSLKNKLVSNKQYDIHVYNVHFEENFKKVLTCQTKKCKKKIIILLVLPVTTESYADSNKS